MNPTNANTEAVCGVKSFKNLDKTVQTLLKEGVEARHQSYSPYSKFAVGAALLCDDGEIFRGCNVESASFGATLCAERTAYAKAISEGRRNFRAIAVIAKRENQFTAPCGICRQFMSEFGNVTVYLAQPNLDQVLCSDLNEMLPYQFKGTGNYTFE